MSLFKRNPPAPFEPPPLKRYLLTNGKDEIAEIVLGHRIRHSGVIHVERQVGSDQWETIALAGGYQSRCVLDESRGGW